MKAKANKYKVAPKEERTLNGIVFASKKEMRRYQELLLLEKAGSIRWLKLQPVFEFYLKITSNGTDIPNDHISTTVKYIGDFQYVEHTKEENKLVVEDVKGVETKEFKRKKRWMKKLYPNVELRIIK